jgi:cyclic dehypoxanthinyl futalosine synthase
MVFGAGGGEDYGGAGDGLGSRLDFLEAVRRLQEETEGFAAFVPTMARRYGGRSLDEATAVECLKVLATSRMFLDGIEHVWADWPDHGLKVRQMSLRFGADDAGSVMLDGPALGGLSAKSSSLSAKDSSE